MTAARGPGPVVRGATAATVALAASALLAAAALAAPAAPARSSAAAHNGADTLVFVQKGVLKAYDPADGHIETIARSAGGDAAVSPDGKLVAYIAGDRSLHVVGVDGKGDRRVAKGPLGSPLWRSPSELGATRPATGSGTPVDAVKLAVSSGKETGVARGVQSQVFPFGADLVARLAPGCTTNDLFLGMKALAKTPLISELPLDTAADLGILAVARTQASSFQCAPASVPVPTALRVYDAGGTHRLIVSLGRIPANQPVDGAFSPEGTDIAYVTAAGNLAVRSFLTRKDRILARGGVSALDW